LVDFRLVSEFTDSFYIFIIYLEVGKKIIVNKTLSKNNRDKITYRCWHGT